MITAILLSCFIIVVSAVPVTQKGVSQDQKVQPIEATNQTPEGQTLAQIPPRVVQPQPGVPQQLAPLDGNILAPSLQHYTWPPPGDSLMIIPQQPNIHLSQLVNHPSLPQQSPMFPPYGYFLLFSSPYRNHLFSPYGFSMILEAPLPQSPANQPPNSPVLPAETPAGAAPARDVPQPIQQQQNPQVLYMVQQSMSSPLASLSSEELEMAAKMGQLGMYMPTVLTNLPTGGVAQSVGPAAGLTDQVQAGVVPTGVTPAAPAQQTQQPANAGPQGLERAAHGAATVQTPVQLKLRPTQGNVI